MTNTPNISSLDNSLVADYIKEVISCCNPEDGFIYFANKFAKCIHPVHGQHDVSLYGFQEDFLKNVHSERVSVNMLPRQMGKTLCTAVYIAWRMIFLNNETIVVTGPKVSFSKQLLEQVRFILDRCPAWLKSSLIVDNKTELKLSNGSRLYAKSFDPNSVKGLSLSFLFVDEAGSIETRKMNEFLQSVYPALYSTKGQLAITSTPGFDDKAFNEIWKISQEKDSMFTGFKASWQDHPERDTAWKSMVVNQIGQAAFEREYECIFNDS